MDLVLASFACAYHKFCFKKILQNCVFFIAMFEVKKNNFFYYVRVHEAKLAVNIKKDIKMNAALAGNRQHPLSFRLYIYLHF
jgi:hypothetical protein